MAYRLLFASALALLPTLSWSAESAAPKATETTAAAAAAAKNIEVKIEGMHCGPCAKAVSENLQKIPGIETASVQVSLKENKAKLKVQKADAATIEAIKKAVADAGFTVQGEPKIN